MKRANTHENNGVVHRTVSIGKGRRRLLCDLGGAEVSVGGIAVITCNVCSQMEMPYRPYGAHIERRIGKRSLTAFQQKKKLSKKLQNEY